MMKISSLSIFICIVSIPRYFCEPDQRCCPLHQTMVQKNDTKWVCQLSAAKRVQTNFAKNALVSQKKPGKCIEVFAQNQTGIFEVDHVGDVQKKETVKVKFYPKCCHLGQFYNEKLHSCSPSDSSTNIVPNNTFIFVGLPQCEIIRDVLISKLSMVDWSEGRLRFLNEDRRLEEGKFCIDATISGFFVVRVCEKYEICEKIRCIRKCCQDGQSFVNGSKCTDTFRYGVNLRVSGKIEDPHGSYAIIHGMPRPLYILKNNRNFNIDKTGTFSIYSNVSGKYDNYQPSDASYCIEHAVKGKKLNDYTIFSRALKPHLEMKFAVTRWIKILSCIFLFLTMAVYLMLPKMLNLFGKILLSYSFATFLFFFFLCLTQFLSTEFNDVMCKIMGFLAIMASYWSFTWLNIMCIDIWVSFGTPRTFSGPLQRNEWKKLIQYSIYGWGFPLLWVLIIVIFNTTKMLPKSIHPFVGFKKCYMENTGDQPGNYAYNIFITFPVLLQQIANIVLFVKTLIYCLKIRGDIQKMNESSKKNYRVGKEELNLVMKLAVIMGVSFVFETISSMYDFSKSPVTRNIEVVWDTINCLQGVFIFVVFICKRKVFNSLLEKWNIRRPCKYDVSSSQGTQESMHTNSTKRNTMALH